MLESDALRQYAIHILDENKAVDIKDIDVTDLTNVTDHMIICSATSSRHSSALADKLIRGLRDQGVRPIGVEGQEEGEWILVDLGDAVVHIMLQAQRDFYDLEKLWRATEKVRQQHED